MKKLRQHKICKIVWIVIALHILNFSIDPPDAQEDSIAEDLSYNEIESITEWFTEDVLQMKDTFKETDEQNENENGVIKKVIDLTFYKVHFKKIERPITFLKIKKNISNIHYSEPYCAVNYIAIFSPPPEA